MKIISFCISILLMFNLVACSSNKEWISNIPNPSDYFEGASINTYEIEDYNLKGYTVKSEESLEESYGEYIDACSQIDIWSELFYEDDDSWCYITSDGLKSFCVEYSEERNEIDISVREYDNDK